MNLALKYPCSKYKSEIYLNNVLHGSDYLKLCIICQYVQVRRFHTILDNCCLSWQNRARLRMLQLFISPFLSFLYNWFVLSFGEKTEYVQSLALILYDAGEMAQRWRALALFLRPGSQTSVIPVPGDPVPMYACR